MKLPKTQEKKVLWGIRIGQEDPETNEQTLSDVVYRFGVFNENVQVNEQALKEEGGDPLGAIPNNKIDELFTNKEQGGK